MPFKFTWDIKLKTIAKKSTNQYLTFKNHMTEKHKLEPAINQKLITGQQEKYTWGGLPRWAATWAHNMVMWLWSPCFDTCHLILIWLLVIKLNTGYWGSHTS